jgi:large subunit ribosomal protein L17
MPHQISGRHLNRNSARRKALFRGLIAQVLVHERIETTEAKAKAVRGDVDKMITLGKRGDLHARRLALQTVSDKKIVEKLFDTLGPRYAERNGGYTRIVRLGQRHGDAAEMVLLELVDRDTTPKGKAADDKAKKK